MVTSQYSVLTIVGPVVISHCERLQNECEVHTVIGLLFLMLPELMFTWGIYLFNYNIALRMRAFSIMQREFCPVL